MNTDENMKHVKNTDKLMKYDKTTQYKNRKPEEIPHKVITNLINNQRNTNEDHSIILLYTY
jgi:hypothetical protein